MLYERVIEVEERYSAIGEELIPINLNAIRLQLQAAFDDGIRSCAIVFMHGYRYPDHEKLAAKLARDIGFTQRSVSHEVSPLMKLVSRGDTTVVDAYLSPILRRYVNHVSSNLGNSHQTPRLMFMQSNGGLVDAQSFQGKDSILSGPAGGIVGAVQTSKNASFNKIITFDMGGTSTDVAHYNGEYERTFETEIAGVRLQTPMMAIHTVAAGGGSILQFDGSRYRVGPESAGANPGPACYRLGGPLTVTDANVMLGKLQPDFFPKVFGHHSSLALDAEIVKEKFTQLAAEIGDNRTPEQVAAGFVAIAVENMANAIKKISLQRGYDVSEYTLCCFGGAGGQHACLIADSLGIKQIFIHPYAGVLSAYGMGLADIRVLREQTIETQLKTSSIEELANQFEILKTQATKEISKNQSVHPSSQSVSCKAHLKYQGTDSSLIVNFSDVAGMTEQFEMQHRQRYGFIMENKQLIVQTISVEVVQPSDIPEEPLINRSTNNAPHHLATVQMYTANTWHETPVFQRQDLQPGDCISGAAIIIESTGTNIIETGWKAELNSRNHLILKKIATPELINHRSLAHQSQIRRSSDAGNLQ